MKSHLLIGSAVALALIAPAAASSDDDKRGKRFEELRKFEEQRAKEHSKAAEQFAKAREKRIEQHAKRAEKRAEQRRKFVEQRLKHQEKLAEQYAKHEDKLFEKRAKRLEKLAERRAKAREKTLERLERRDDDDDGVRSFGRLSSPYYVPANYRSLYRDDENYYYRTAPQGLVRLRRDNDLVSALIPMLGRAFSVGQPLPLGYSAYNVPLQYRDMYYDTGDRHYRYGDRAIFSVDPKTNLIQGVAALLTGNQLGVGSRLPMGFDAYNVPLDYRDRYVDSAAAMYRYSDGNIYQVDPTTRLITAVIQAMI